MFPGEQTIALELRAFMRSGGAAGEVVAVAANDDAHRDARRPLVEASDARAGKDGHALDVRIVVPFASLKLAPGRYELAYELRGLREGQIDFARATAMTPLVVSDAHPD